MHYFKQSILISLLFFAAVAYMPSSHIAAYNASADSNVCTQDLPMSAR
jgi:hypothetical protein